MLHPKELGLDALAGLLDISLDGIAVSSADGTFLYANPAAFAVYGYKPEELIGKNFLFNVAERDHARIIEVAQGLSQGQPARITLSIVRPSGEERQIDISSMNMQGVNGVYPVAFFRDTTEERRLQLEGSALMEIAQRVAFGGSLKDTLDEICAYVLGVTGALASAVVLVDPVLQQPRMVGVHGLPEGYMEAANQLLADGVRVLSVETLAQNRPLVQRGVRANLLTYATHQPMHRFLGQVAWDTIVGVPMQYGERAVGVLLSYHAPTQEIGEVAIKFHSALASQAAVAVENARLLSQVHEKAALEERQRLARELHDSVSQAIYSISLQARSARILLDRDPSRLQEPLDEVLHLSRAAMAEMRALIFELRPGALQEEGLVEAVRKHAAGVAARERIAVDVLTPAGTPPRLKPQAEEALYRIVQEALHNVVKHAHATRAQVEIAARGPLFTLTIGDDGQGFDPTEIPAGHMGLGTMRQRTLALGGDYTVTSAPGHGATISAALPLADWKI